MTKQKCRFCGAAFTGKKNQTVCIQPECRRQRANEQNRLSRAKKHGAESAFERQAAPAPQDGNGPACSSHPEAPACPAPSRPALPWASPAVCRALATGIGAEPAKKHGLFYVCAFGYGEVQAFIPRPGHPKPLRERIVLVARLNPRGRWDVRVPPLQDVRVPKAATSQEASHA